MPSSGTNQFICIHGHFYQPPRENAWLEEIQDQVTASPFHNWNERINYECYAPNRAARILNDREQIRRIFNNYRRISFNIGPTLMSWLEIHDGDSYKKIIDADKDSVHLFGGHGNALAQVYNHMIMPLANEADKETQVRWGIYDFERRFERKPEGMWLAETAVDIDTLDVMARFGIKFTILAPRQVAAVKEMDAEKWLNVDENTVPTNKPYHVNLKEGRSIAVFIYNGEISREVAFNGLLNDGHYFAGRLLAGLSPLHEGSLTHIATDGETYGHHHKYGEMALAACLDILEQSDKVTLINYGYFLEKFPPTSEALIIENSSWSCVHGIDRWRNDCGCHTGGHIGWNQAYRAPLRDGLNWLRDRLSELYLTEGTKIFHDTHKVRNEYIAIILNRSERHVKNFLKTHLKSDANDEKTYVNALRLLEMQRNAMLMFTSCGWFFDEISGLETTQILQYARRAIVFAEYFGLSLESEFHQWLRKMPSNHASIRNGLHVYKNQVLPAEIRLEKVAMHISVLSIFQRMPAEKALYTFLVTNTIFKRYVYENKQYIIGQSTIRSVLTFSEYEYRFAVLYLGQTHLAGFLDLPPYQPDFEKIIEETKAAFFMGDMDTVLSDLHKFFGTEKFGFQDLFQDDKIRLLRIISTRNMKTMVDSFHKIYAANNQVLNEMRSIGFPVSKSFVDVVSFVANTGISDQITGANAIDFEQLNLFSVEMEKWKLKLANEEEMALNVENKLFGLMHQFKIEQENLTFIRSLHLLLDWVEKMGMKINLWKTQNEFYEIQKQLPALLSGNEEILNLRKRLNFTLEENLSGSGTQVVKRK